MRRAVRVWRKRLKRWRTYQDEVVGALLVVVHEGEERTVVLLQQELEGGGVLERADLILPAQAEPVWLHKLCLSKVQAMSVKAPLPA